MRQPLSPRRFLTGAAIAVAAGAALALPSTGMGGVAAVQDDVLTTASIAEIPQRLQLVRNTQAKVARFDILWSFVASGRQPANPADPNDPAYDWTRVQPGADRPRQGEHHPDREHVQHADVRR